MTAARIAWDIPDLSACNSFKGYQIYLGTLEKNILLINKCKYLR
jgi:hypothetical protein